MNAQQQLADLILDHQVHVATRRCACGTTLRTDRSLPNAMADHLAGMLLPLVDPKRLASAHPTVAPDDR